jgi:hypothetical protein
MQETVGGLKVSEGDEYNKRRNAYEMPSPSLSAFLGSVPSTTSSASQMPSLSESSVGWPARQMGAAAAVARAIKPRRVRQRTCGEIKPELQLYRHKSK